MPMRYKDETLGIISLGRKKSGKMFTLEDLELLKTMTNQSAMALENARLFQEYLEKTRLDEELKIAYNIQVSMLPEKAPLLPGIQIAARSLPGRWGAISTISLRCKVMAQGRAWVLWSVMFLGKRCLPCS